MGRTPRIGRAAKQFGSRVREIRQEKGWSIERLAEASDLHWTYVGSAERGERNVSLQNILKIAYALDVDAAELVQGIEPD
jgi:transcriptional regulator with XRE-family HTH domain